MHIATRCIVFSPDALVAFFRNGVEGPDQVTGFGIKGLDETTDAVLTTIGSDQNFSVYHRRRHGLAVALLGICDFNIPCQFASLRVQRHQASV